MKTFKKVSAIVLSIAIVLLCIAPALPVFGEVMSETAFAQSAESATYTDLNNYYGKRLTDPTSVAFYGILENMNFASGESVQIFDKTILDEASMYAVGDPSILRKFGAAVDSFKYDHTEYFYVDFDMLTLNVKTRGNTLIVELGAGRSDSYFAEGFTKDNISQSVQWYNNELDAFVRSINIADDATAEQKAKAVTRAVANKVTYSFCVNSDGQDTEGAPYIRTAYGALKYGKCVCEGYSRIFKAVMDKLGEVNVLVNGWLADGDAIGAHMWNLVKTEDGWYGVDPTVADNDQAEYDARGFDWAQGELLGNDHFEERVISTSDYEMPFPTIFRSELPSDNTLFENSDLKIEAVTLNEGGADVPYYAVTYQGLDANAVTEQLGYYMVMRTSGTSQGSEIWSDWTPMQEVEKLYQKMLVKTENGVTYFNLDSIKNDRSKLHVQFGIATAEPDKESLVSKSYSEAFFNANCAVQSGNVYTNADNDPEYRVPIFAMSDPMSISLDTTYGEQPREVSVRYNQPLVYTDDSNVPAVTFTAKLSVDGTPIDDIGDYASVSNIRLSDDKTTISFTFRPSISFSHNEVIYTFSVTNMQCRYSDGLTAKAKDFSLATKRTSIVCNRVYGDGRLYVEAFGTPTLVDNTDLSVNGWSYKDKNGNVQKVSQSQRSQLALVVKTPQNKEQLEGAVESKLGDTMSMATYELDLNICSRIATIPAGSYMKLSFGFPAGIDASMEGVEFEVFHFKKKANGDLDYDNPERLNCVVTKYGLTVTVNSFSPFVIVARESTPEDAARKGILTSLNGLGGMISADTNKSVNFLDAAGQSVTYTLTPDSGYAVEYVMLGDRELQVGANGTVTVKYEDLQEKNNILSVGFAKQSVIDAEQAAGEVNLAKTFAAKTYDKTYGDKPEFDYPNASEPTTPDNPNDGSETPTNPGAPDKNELNVRKIAIIVAVIVAVFIIVGIITGLVVKKKNKNSNDVRKNDKAENQLPAKTETAVQSNNAVNTQSNTTVETNETVTQPIASETVPETSAEAPTADDGTAEPVSAKAAEKSTSTATAKPTVSKATPKTTASKSTATKSTSKTASTAASKPTVSKTTAKTTTSKSATTKSTSKAASTAASKPTVSKTTPKTTTSKSTATKSAAKTTSTATAKQTGSKTTTKTTASKPATTKSTAKSASTATEKPTVSKATPKTTASKSTAKSTAKPASSKNTAKPTVTTRTSSAKTTSAGSAAKKTSSTTSKNTKTTAKK